MISVNEFSHKVLKHHVLSHVLQSELNWQFLSEWQLGIIPSLSSWVDPYLYLFLRLFLFLFCCLSGLLLRWLWLLSSLFFFWFFFVCFCIEFGGGWEPGVWCATLFRDSVAQNHCSQRRTVSSPRCHRCLSLFLDIGWAKLLHLWSLFVNCRIFQFLYFIQR